MVWEWKSFPLSYNRKLGNIKRLREIPILGTTASSSFSFVPETSIIIYICDTKLQPLARNPVSALLTQGHSACDVLQRLVNAVLLHFSTKYVHTSQTFAIHSKIERLAYNYKTNSPGYGAFQVDELVLSHTCQVCKIHTGHSLGALLGTLASTASHAQEPAVIFAPPGQLQAAKWLGKDIRIYVLYLQNWNWITN